MPLNRNKENDASNQSVCTLRLAEEKPDLERAKKHFCQREQRRFRCRQATETYYVKDKARANGLPHRSGPTRMLGSASVSSGVMPLFLDGTGYKQWAALVLGVKVKDQVAVWIGTARGGKVKAF